MKVALLSRAAWPLHEPGGMERAVYNLAKHLNANDVETTLFTRPASREGAFPGGVVTIPYGSLPGGAHGRVLDRTLNYPAFSTRLGRAVAERVAAGSIEIVCAQGLTALGYGRLRRTSRSLRAPLVMNPQGMEEHKTRGFKRFALARLVRLSREAARLSDRVIATDQATRAEVIELLRVEPGRVSVVPNGIDLEELDRATPDRPREYAAAAVPALADASPLLLSVGRLERYKGFDDTLEALRLLRERRALPGRWAWAIVGEGPHRRRLAEAARSEPRVHLLGRVDDALLHALYERADLFVHATHYEGSSLVTLEAMAHRLPVVATRAGGIPDKVVAGETGYLVDVKKPAALADAILKVLQNGRARATLGARGREHAARNFGWPAIAKRTIALFESLLQGRGR